MAHPPHLFRADGRLDELVPHIRLWSVDMVDKIGSDPRSAYAEDFSLRNWAPVACTLVGDERGVPRRWWGQVRSAGL
jgi:hypothetical protein